VGGPAPLRGCWCRRHPCAAAQLLAAAPERPGGLYQEQAGAEQLRSSEQSSADSEQKQMNGGGGEGDEATMGDKGDEVGAGDVSNPATVRRPAAPTPRYCHGSIIHCKLFIVSQLNRSRLISDQ
jgi:hypothetical protein